MKRFRFTLLAVCLVLLFLGGNDLLRWWRNQQPASISISAVEADGPPQEWLHITGGHQDLDRAISTSGTIELEALLVPLVSDPDQTEIRVLVETRNPRLLELFRQYHFFTDTLPEKRAFRASHAEAFKGQRDVTGMLVSGLIVKGNRQKLFDLAKQTGMEVADDVLFVSEGKEPAFWRGMFFAAVGIFGLIRLWWEKAKNSKP